MSLAQILVVIDGAPGGDAVLATALRLGREFRARVEVLHVEADAESSLPVMGEGMSGAAVEQVLQNLRADAQARLEEARRLYEAAVVAKKLPTVEPDAEAAPGNFAVCFRHLTGREPEEVLHRARLSDVTVLSQSRREGEASVTFDTVLFDSGRPLLIAPDTAGKTLGDTVAIAWDRSRESVRAVHAALPLLGRAKTVIVMTARQGDDSVEPSELSRYLAAHGIDSRTWAFATEGGAIGDSLLGEAAKAEADLLVMGGYGHSRLRELVLGGVTRGILAKATLPVFMMH